MNMKNIKKIANIILISALMFILIGYILMPTLNTVRISMMDDGGFTLRHFKEFFAQPLSKDILINTFSLGIATVIVCGIIGTTLAFAVNYFDFPFRGLLSKLLLMPIILPGIIIVISFIQLYAESGLVTKSIQLLFHMDKIPFTFTGFWGILFVHAYTQYVYFYLNVSVAIKHMDFAAIEAAKNLGASKIKVFTSIIVPFMRPALLSSTIITFMSGIGSFSAPNLIGDRFKVLTTQILFAKSNQAIAQASVQVVLLTMMSITVLLLIRHYEKQNQFVQSARAVKIVPRKIRGKIAYTLFIILILLLVLLILLPIICVFVLSFVKPGTWMIDIFPKSFSLDNYIKIFTKARAMAPFVNSIVMSVTAILMVLAVALPCSYITMKTKNKLNPVIGLLTMLPWAIPASAMGLNLINYFNKRSIFSFNQILIGTAIILPIAYFINILPLVLRSINLSMGKLNDNYTEISKTLGAGGITTFVRVTLPIISPGIISGIILGFIRCIGEYTMSLYLFTTASKPISVAMVNGVFEYDLGLAMAYGVLTIVVTTMLVSIEELVTR